MQITTEVILRQLADHAQYTQERKREEGEREREGGSPKCIKDFIIIATKLITSLVY